MKRQTSFMLVLSICAAIVGSAAPAMAHVGNDDVYFDAPAGPYKLFLTVRPPQVIPGVADVQIRAAESDIERLRIVPLPLRGEGARFAPTPDVATRLREDPQTFTGHLWMMTAGAWQVRVLVEGKRGPGELAVPVPTLPRRTNGMQQALAIVLIALLGVLVFGLISIIGASAGEAQLGPGLTPDGFMQRRSQRARVVTAILLGLMIWGGAQWWRSEAERYDQNLYRPLGLDAAVAEGKLQLTLKNPSGVRTALDDLVPDHDHLMHLFVLSMPEMNRMFHLHPEQTGSGTFAQQLPALSAGTYRLYADIVHQTGVPETLVSDLIVPTAIAGSPLTGDDSTGEAPPLSAADVNRTVSPLADGGQAIFVRSAGSIIARAPQFFRFRIESQPGQPAQDLELYMGMLGHAAFIKRDGSVFSHLHPSGSVPMAMLDLVRNDDAPGDSKDGHAGHMGHMGHAMAGGLPSEVSFPYGFPQAGDYRIFVQIKRHGAVQTAAFDVHVEPAAAQ